MQLTGVRRHVGLQAAGALLLRALHDQLQADRQVVAEGPQRGEVHDDVALAVGGAAPVPAAVALGQLEGGAQPLVLGQRRLDVVVRVEQDGRGAGRAGQLGVDGLGAVGGVEQSDTGQAFGGEGVGDPVGGLLALLDRELTRIGDRSEGDQFGQVGAGAVHQGPDGVGQGLLRHRVCSG